MKLETRWVCLVGLVTAVSLVGCRGEGSGSSSPTFGTTVPPGTPTDTTPPAQATGLTATPGDAQVTLSWTASTSPDVSFYNVRVSTNGGASFGSPINVANVTTATITGLTNGIVHRFLLTVVDTAGNESSQATAPFVDATPGVASIRVSNFPPGGLYRLPPIAVELRTTEPCAGGNCIVFTTDNTDPNPGGCPAGVNCVDSGEIVTLDEAIFDATSAGNTCVIFKFRYVNGPLVSLTQTTLYEIRSNPPTADAGANTFFKFSGARRIRMAHTSTLLTAGTNSGDVVHIGGRNFQPGAVSPLVFDDAEIYDVPCEHYEALAVMVNLDGAGPGPARYDHASAGLGDGRVLVTGGHESDDITNSTDDAQILDVAAVPPAFAEASSASPIMETNRFLHTATRLFHDVPASAQVAVIGGRSVLRLALPVLVAPTVGAGGTVPIGVNTYVVTARNVLGEETTASASVTATTVGGSQTVTLDWADIAGATDYQIYRDDPGGATDFNLITAVTASTFVDDNVPAPTPGTEPPRTNEATRFLLSSTATNGTASATVIEDSGQAFSGVSTRDFVRVGTEIGEITNVDPADSGDPVGRLTVRGLITPVGVGTTYRVFRASPSASAERFDPTLAATDRFVPTAGSMVLARFGHTATLLPDGTVLVVGGNTDFTTATNGDLRTELYNRASDTFLTPGSGTSAFLSVPRFYHAATLLNSGKVLITGGVEDGTPWVVSNQNFSGASVLGTAEIFDPPSGTMTKLTGSMGSSRFFHQATLLLDGRVLITGGVTRISSTGIMIFENTTEIFDPVLETFTAGPVMIEPRMRHTAVRLNDARVLMTGGSFTDLAELYVPSTNLFAATAHGATGDRVIGSSAVRLRDGTVLVSGGQTSLRINATTGNLEAGPIQSTAETYDTQRIRYTPTTGAMNVARRFHTSTLLDDGRVLIVGGENVSGPVATCQLYDPTAATFTSTGSMTSARFSHSATKLLDGRVLVAGGDTVIGATATAEIYNVSAGTWATTGSMSRTRVDHQATLLFDGRVLVTGGNNIFDRSAEIFDPAISAFDADSTTPALDPVFGGDTAMEIGRDEHRAEHIEFSVGRATFTNGSTTVAGIGTNWSTVFGAGSPPAIDDFLIVNHADGRIYRVASVASDTSLTLTTAYTGTTSPGAGIGDFYTIFEEDAVLLGGEFGSTIGEIFVFDALSTNPFQPDGGVALLSSGRVGHTMTPYTTNNGGGAAPTGRRILVAGGSTTTGTGDVITAPVHPNAGVPGTYTLFSSPALDAGERPSYHTAFRLNKGVGSTSTTTFGPIILLTGHGSQVFFTD